MEQHLKCKQKIEISFKWNSIWTTWNWPCMDIHMQAKCYTDGKLHSIIKDTYIYPKPSLSTLSTKSMICFSQQLLQERGYCREKLETRYYIVLWREPGNETIVGRAWEWVYCEENLGMSLLWGEPGNESIVRRAWEWVYCGGSLGMSLLWGEPGNESIVGRVWEWVYCEESLGMSLLWGESGNESIVRRAWEWGTEGWEWGQSMGTRVLWREVGNEARLHQCTIHGCVWTADMRVTMEPCGTWRNHRKWFQESNKWSNSCIPSTLQCSYSH